MARPFGRREFLRRAGAAGVFTAGCRARATGQPIVLRLSHSMTAGPTSLHSFGVAFQELAEAATGGAVQVRLFPSGTLGQEREVVQQLQEGLVDFMVSGTAIWGSVAPKLQVFDFPFLWRDWDARARGRGRIASAARPRTTWRRPCACALWPGAIRSGSGRWSRARAK